MLEISALSAAPALLASSPVSEDAKPNTCMTATSATTTSGSTVVPISITLRAVFTLIFILLPFLS